MNKFLRLAAEFERFLAFDANLVNNEWFDKARNALFEGYLQVKEAEGLKDREILQALSADYPRAQMYMQLAFNGLLRV